MKGFIRSLPKLFKNLLNSVIRVCVWETRSAYRSYDTV